MDTVITLLLPSLLIILVLGFILLVGIGFVHLGLITMVKRFNRCPKCGKNDAGMIIETVVVSKDNYMDYKRYPPSRVIEQTLEDQYQCQFCKHSWARTAKEIKRTKVKV